MTLIIYTHRHCKEQQCTGSTNLRFILLQHFLDNLSYHACLQDADQEDKRAQDCALSDAGGDIEEVRDMSLDLASSAAVTHVRPDLLTRKLQEAYPPHQ